MYANIQKFIQFQLTVNVAALVINFVAAVSSGDVPLNAVQVLSLGLLAGSVGLLLSLCLASLFLFYPPFPLFLLASIGDASLLCLCIASLG